MGSGRLSSSLYLPSMFTISQVSSHIIDVQIFELNCSMYIAMSDK